MEVLLTFSNPRKFHRQKEFRSADATDSNALLVWWRPSVQKTRRSNLTRNGDGNAVPSARISILAVQVWSRVRVSAHKISLCLRAAVCRLPRRRRLRAACVKLFQAQKHIRNRKMSENFNAQLAAPRSRRSHAHSHERTPGQKAKANTLAGQTALLRLPDTWTTPREQHGDMLCVSSVDFSWPKFFLPVYLKNIYKELKCHQIHRHRAVRGKISILSQLPLQCFEGNMFHGYRRRALGVILSIRGTPEGYVDQKMSPGPPSNKW